jgi:hypothetical protein
MSAAFFCTCGHGTERMTGSAPGPAKVATRMVLLRMGLCPLVVARMSASEIRGTCISLRSCGLPDSSARPERKGDLSVLTFRAPFNI